MHTYIGLVPELEIKELSHIVGLRVSWVVRSIPGKLVKEDGYFLSKNCDINGLT
jgi:hypothetical protein